MARLSAKSRVYKDTTAQQLRSFHETARLGSFSAAAKSLGLANPTVWQQVRALELDFGEPLLEPRGRGCRPHGGRPVARRPGRPVGLGGRDAQAAVSRGPGHS